ncbi:MAG: hypothetical protein IPO26_17225 [Saprospiraceae bacterium]|nr:hypothetical protein [Saprospiraceae bacterium]
MPADGKNDKIYRYFAVMPESIPSPHKPLVIAFDAKRLFNNFTGLGNYSRTLVRNLHQYFPENEYHLSHRVSLKM